MFAKNKRSILFLIILFGICVVPTGIICSFRKLGIICASASLPINKSDSQELQTFKLENAILKEQLLQSKEYLLSDEKLDELMERIALLKENTHNLTALKNFFKRRQEDFLRRLDALFSSVPGQIVYREPALWSSFIWVNAGEKENKKLGQQIIGKNSPVVMGNSVIGVVEEVHQNRSKIRLITDPSLNISVRVSRENALLAKGELHGTHMPLWRSLNLALKGIGFNYDYTDEEGQKNEKAIPLIKEGDLLVTTGYDGIFPPGFYTAIVKKVFPLAEGSYTYEIDAKPIENLSELKTVWILPPL